MAKTVKSICDAFIKDLAKVRNSASNTQKVLTRKQAELNLQRAVLDDQQAEQSYIIIQADTAINNIKGLFGVKE